MGFGVVGRVNGGFARVDHGTFRPRPDMSHPERLRFLFLRVKALLDHHRPDILALEQTFFAQERRSRRSASARRARSCSSPRRSAASRWSSTRRATVKLSVTGHGGADKILVQEMVARELNLDAVPSSPRRRGRPGARPVRPERPGVRPEVRREFSRDSRAAGPLLKPLSSSGRKIWPREPSSAPREIGMKTLLSAVIVLTTLAGSGCNSTGSGADGRRPRRTAGVGPARAAHHRSGRQRRRRRGRSAHSAPRSPCRRANRRRSHGRPNGAKSNARPLRSPLPKSPTSRSSSSTQAEVPAEVRAIEKVIDRRSALLADTVRIEVSKNYEWDVSLTGDGVSPPKARPGRNDRRGDRQPARVLPQHRHPRPRQDHRLALGPRRDAVHQIRANGAVSYIDTDDTTGKPRVKRADNCKINNASIKFDDEILGALGDAPGGAADGAPGEDQVASGILVDFHRESGGAARPPQPRHRRWRGCRRRSRGGCSCCSGQRPATTTRPRTSSPPRRERPDLPRRRRQDEPLAPRDRGRDARRAPVHPARGHDAAPAIVHRRARARAGERALRTLSRRRQEGGAQGRGRASSARTWRSSS